MRDGKLDALLDVAQNDERKPQLVWTRQALLVLALHLVGNRTQNDVLPGFAAMQHKRVGITRGYEYPGQMTGQPGIQLVESPSELGNLRHLAKGDIDFMLLSRGTLATLLAKLGPQERQHIRDWGQIDQLPLYLAFSPGQPLAAEWAAAFDRGMQAIRKSGEDQRIHERWRAVP
ncbi:hypothetical protein IGB42_00970 [Andreprevotia sp. IGB-42]|uniref:substrate-binding periplasmic protein n=1 Tax=Andreprevotia sp. IGB-42 TaxID=2497473 RepID=UPI001359AA49|nr:transporter substrate-binding domain-containing protein [Andreprevotia sp. IGB-42]KAF0814914.1 hypothetical protein IGB42_00970 [Andreprevotia sp. IGB-42]